MKKFLFFIIILFIPIIVYAEDLTPNSTSAILIEASTGNIIYEKNKDEKLPPASMTKVMSMLLIMEQIDKGNITFKDKVTISKNAASMGGSQVFLNEGDEYTVLDLLKSIAIASGNDAVVAMSEYVAGSTEEFVKLMNKKAKELNLKNTHFVNPHGLDIDNHYTSANDMAIIAKELLKYPKILDFTSIYEYYLPKNDGSTTWLVNTNKLVRFYKGVDGLKTGFTENAGYCLTATAKKNNMRLISVVMGVGTSELRSLDTTTLLDFGFNSYKVDTIVKSSKSLGKVRVKNGKSEYVKVYLKEDATRLFKNTDEKTKYTYKIKVDKKLKAPIKKGAVIGKLYIYDKNKKILSKNDITVKKDIKKANLWDLFKRNLKEITIGKNIIKNA